MSKTNFVDSRKLFTKSEMCALIGIKIPTLNARIKSLNLADGVDIKPVSLSNEQFYVEYEGELIPVEVNARMNYYTKDTFALLRSYKS